MLTLAAWFAVFAALVIGIVCIGIVADCARAARQSRKDTEDRLTKRQADLTESVLFPRHNGEF